jgi:hypothetical protein
MTEGVLMRAGWILLGLGLAATGAAAPQTSDAGKAFRTPWGDPDLQGIWTNATLTPLERPDNAPDKEYLTEEEAAAIDGSGIERVLAPLKPEVEASGELNEAYMEIGQVVRTRRTSLVIDPPNGKVPFTPEGRARRGQEFRRLIGAIPINSYEDRPMNDRCLLTGGLITPNPFYLNNHQIFQTRDHVAIKSEVMNETRIIPLDGRPPLDDRIRLWGGSSRGHWEGDTLVVETANYNGRSVMFGSTAEQHVVERFTRVDASTIDYEATISDPASYTEPWTLANTMRAIEGPIYEYACHEGNYGLVNILEGVRAQEAAKAKQQEKAAPVKN